MGLLPGEILRNKELILDSYVGTHGMLKQAGCFKVRTECRAVPLGRSAGQEGIDCSTDRRRF